MLKKWSKLVFLVIIAGIAAFTSLTHAQEQTYATLLKWETFNEIIKTLAAWHAVSGSVDDITIKTIKRSNDKPPQSANVMTGSAKTSDYLIKVWFDWIDTIYYYTQADKIYMNSNSSYLFRRLNALENLDLSSFDTSNVTNMQNMFLNNYKLTNLDLSNFDTSNVENMQWMFNGCNKLKNIDLSSFNTSNVKKMQSMFYDCISLTSLDLSNFNTSGVENMQSMFAGNNRSMALTTIYTSDSFVINTDSTWTMFKYCNNLVWGNWTKYDSLNINGKYAKIDKPSQSWYFTAADNITVNFMNIDNEWIQTLQHSYIGLSKWDMIPELTSDEIVRETGYSLEYYTDSWMTIKFDFDQHITEYTEIYTKWVVNQYHIAFVDRKWEVVSWADYNYGTEKADIVLPEVPEREWYEFSGWEWIPETMPAENVTWTAQYNVRQYTITFVKWNGEDDYVITLNYWSGVTPLANPTREWYTFKGWDKEIPETMPAENLIITAKWEANKSWNWWSWRWRHNNSENESVWDGENKTQELDTILEDNTKKDNKTQLQDNTQNVAHEWSYNNWLTKYINASDARLGNSLTRSEMAKLASIFATKVLWETPDESKQSFCSQFADMSKLSREMGEYVIKACELWYMWYQSNWEDKLVNFRPYSPVTVAEAAVIVSRMMRWNQNAADGISWYKWHLYAAYNYWLIDDIRNPYRNITRWETFEMFYRTSK